MHHFSHRRAVNKQHAHHKTRLHTTKVITILIPSFHGLRWERPGPWPTIWVGPTKKKRLHF